MKLLFDQNLSPRLASVLQNDFPGSSHVQDVGLGSAFDDEIWNFAKKEDFCVVTKDADFSELFLVKPSAPKIVWLKVGNCSTNMILKKILNNAKSIKELKNKEKGILIIY